MAIQLLEGIQRCLKSSALNHSEEYSQGDNMKGNGLVPRCLGVHRRVGVAQGAGNSVR